jgi:hypothetical protein
VPTEDFEQKYRSLKGKFDAELPLLRNQATTFERINASLSSQVATLTQQLADLQRAAPAPVTEPVRAATDKDVETFGPELIDLITRIAGANAATVKNELANHLRNVEGQVTRTASEVGTVKVSQQQTDRALYEQRLTEAVPNWRDVNATQEWLTWLGEFDPLLGSTRQAAVSAAYTTYDVPRTAAFLNQYAALQRSVESNRPLTPQEELARQVSPRATNAATVTPQPSATTARIWTQAEISAFYTAAIQGKFKANPAEKARIEAEIDTAVSQGRVR